LKENSFQAAEYTNLRLAFEKVSGEDLNWFFNQWYLDKGHPSLSIDMSEKTGSVSIRVNQTQTEFRIFKLPVDIAIYDDRGKTVERVWIDEENEVIDLKTVGKVKNVVFDHTAMLLADLKEYKPADWSIFQYSLDQRWYHRKEAIIDGTKAKTEAAEKMILSALNDPHYNIRSLAISKVGMLSAENKAQAIDKIKMLAETDANSNVRADAIQFLSGNLSASEAKAIFENRVIKDSSYTVSGTALFELTKIDREKGLEIASKFENDKNSFMKSAVMETYSQSSNSKYLSYFHKVFENDELQNMDYFSGARSFLTYLIGLEPEKQKEGLQTIKIMNTNNGYYGQLAVPRLLEFMIENATEKMETYKAAGNQKSKAYESLIEDCSNLKKELGF
jgi:aminopeptidase N